MSDGERHRLTCVIPVQNGRAMVCRHNEREARPACGLQRREPGSKLCHHGIHRRKIRHLVPDVPVVAGVVNSLDVQEPEFEVASGGVKACGEGGSFGGEVRPVVPSAQRTVQDGHPLQVVSIRGKEQIRTHSGEATAAHCEQNRRECLVATAESDAKCRTRDMAIPAMIFVGATTHARRLRRAVRLRVSADS